MVSKITNRTRIKFVWMEMINFRREHGLFFSDDVIGFLEKNAGLKHTSSRWSLIKGQRMYFEVVDKHKWMLAKINYGI